MKCFSCATPVPSEALASNFCIACGRPLSQPCPYELGTTPPRLPLCDASGRATASCPHCNGLFKACDTCLRLHELERSACRTPGCAGTLREPIDFYPTPSGASDGTQAAQWLPGWDAPLKQIVTLAVEEVQAMAFRYGLLIAATRRNLNCYRWDGAQWQSLGIHPLMSSGDMTLHSLHIEQGRVWVLGSDRAQVYALVGGLSRLREEPGIFTQQAVGTRWWMRAGADGTLLLTDCVTWATRAIRLPAEAGEVMDVAGSDPFYLATSNGHVYTLDTEKGELVSLLRQKQRWIRIAVQGSRLALLGYDPSSETGGMTLQVVSADGKTIHGQRTLESGTIPDFAWAGDSLYTARQSSQDKITGQNKSLVETYDTRQLTRAPQIINLSSGASTQSGIVALTDGRKQTRLLLRRLESTTQQWILVNAATGASEGLRPILDRVPSRSGDVDGWPGDAPLLCVADTHLIIASDDGGRTTFRTYAAGG